MLLSSMLDNPWRELEERHAKQVQHAKLAQHASERQAEAAPKNTVAVPKGPISLADILAGALQVSSFCFSNLLALKALACPLDLECA